MLTRGDTVGVFQVESAGMRRALVDMRPDRFEDLIALVALYRPGPMANIPTYCARKHGKEQVEYLHPMLEPILEPTYGIITYQEQVKQIAQRPGRLHAGRGRSPAPRHGQEDQGRDGRAARPLHRAARSSAASAGTWPTTIFDACAKFAEYGFNKSHSAPYALITYQTAYLKANYPVEFMAASLTLDSGNTDKIAEFRREAIRLGMPVEAPSVNRSGVAFDVATTDGKGRILYSLAALKGVGARRSSSWSRRAARQPFRDLADFGRRINPKIINKRVLESLIAAGALDELEPDRARLIAGVDRILGMAGRVQESAAIGQGDMFGAGRGPPAAAPAGGRAVAAGGEAEARARRGRLLSLRPPARRIRRRCSPRCACRPGPSSPSPCTAGATAGRLAGTVTAQAGAAHRAPATRWAWSSSPTPTGSFEAVALLRGAQPSIATCSSPASSVVVLVSAEDRPEGINMRIQSVESLDRVMAGLKQIRVFVRDAAPLAERPEAARRQGRGRGEPRAAARRGPARGRDAAARPLRGDAADRQRAPRRARAWCRWSWCEGPTPRSRSACRAPLAANSPVRVDQVGERHVGANR